MENEFPGPFCQACNLSRSILKDPHNIIPLCYDIPLKNGVIFELKSCFDSVSDIAQVITALHPGFENIKSSSITTKVYRLFEVKKKLNAKKKVNNCSSISELCEQPFDPPNKSIQQEIPLNGCENSNTQTEKPRTVRKDLIDIEPAVHTKLVGSHKPGQSESSNDLTKEVNLYQHQLNKKTKRLRKVEKQVNFAEEKLENLKNKLGHFSVKNVNKRDESARKKLKLIRELQRTVYKQERIILKLEAEVKESCVLKSRVNELQNINDSVNIIVKKKVNAQKIASYYKLSAIKLRKKLDNNHCEYEILKSLKKTVEAKTVQVSELETNVEILQEQLSEFVETKYDEKTFSDNIRLCVIELSGLEVAVEKVPPVISTVSKHLFGHQFLKCELPSSSTVQSIVDEGHFLAKTFISKQLADTENWGLNRDGTTRRKRKILDTTVTLSSGDILSLGFNVVAHETADSINNISKRHVTELAELNKNIDGDIEYDINNFIKSSLEKLAFTMSDRASNEKKADRLLDEWRDGVLNFCTDDSQHSKVLHFHCMAHVLLGFHRYVCKDISVEESKLVEVHGSLGRDGLTCFKYWSKKGTAVERAVRTVSDVFGPSGDHHGVRDIWESYCSANGIKSVIGNYRDNRFNALFQTAAEVCLHRKDFITVLESVKSPNLKLKSVLADLKSDIICLILQCMGLVYCQVTGPYWNLVTCGKVAYLDLHQHIAELLSFLECCAENPTLMLSNNGHWSELDPMEVCSIPNGSRLRTCVSYVQQEHCELALGIIKVIVNALALTITKQLIDFLPGGTFSQPPDEESLARTKFAHVTNLGCEHHFGDLDSSQRRRPSASMHHHSSVQLIKRNRVNMMKWLQDMPKENRKRLLKSARKGGREMRDRHMLQERNVLAEINKEMINNQVKCTKQKGSHKRKRKQDKHAIECEVESNSALEHELSKKLSDCKTVVINEYVAVAYQDAWYPGIATKIVNEQTICVNFMTPSSKSGHFQWPHREDLQEVNVTFILRKGFIPECLNSGRLWYITEYGVIDELYVAYSKLYF